MDTSEPFDIGRAFHHGWAAIQRCFPILWVGGCIRACTNGGGGNGGGGGGSNDSESMLEFGWNVPAFVGDSLNPAVAFGGVGAVEAGVIAFILVAVLVISLIAIAFNAWFLPGWINVQAEIVRTGQGSFGTLFGTIAPFGRMVMWTLLKGAIIVLGALAMSVPLVAVVIGFENDNMIAVAIGGAITLPAVIGFTYVFMGIYFGDHAVALDGAGPLEALAIGWDLIAGRRLSFLIFGLLLTLGVALFALAGLLACVVGLFVTVPLSWAWLDFSFTEAYLRLTRPEEADGWAINTLGTSGS